MDHRAGVSNVTDRASDRIRMPDKEVRVVLVSNLGGGCHPKRGSSILVCIGQSLGRCGRVRFS